VDSGTGVKMGGGEFNGRILTTSWEIWDFLIEKAGLDVKGYDQSIVEMLCKLLNIPTSCKDFRQELKNRKISIELFIGAFLKVLEPYARMMYDLCKFFYTYGVKKTNRSMRILFDFGKGPKDLGFDLEHFRECLRVYREVVQRVIVYGWSYNDLWRLARVFQELWKYEPKDPGARKWLADYVKRGIFSVDIPILPSVGVKELDELLQRAWHVWATIIVECRKYAVNKDDLRKCANMKRDSVKNRQLGDETESDRFFLELVGSKEFYFTEWDPWTLWVLNSDRWPEVMLRGVFGFVEHILSVPEGLRAYEASHVVSELEQIFSGIPYREEERKTLVERFLELLSLPIWRRRFELYQVWVLTQIDKALEDYEREIHHVDGVLIFRFSGTHVGTIETCKGRVHIWSELRSPLAEPLGGTRKRHIQPDYTLTFEPITDSSRTLVVVECKQYFRPSPKRFATTLIDYAKGHPRATVILVNYGTISEKILRYIPESLNKRTVFIGNFKPNCPREFNLFKNAILGAIPKPSYVERRTSDLKNIDLIVVDISGSMRHLLDNENVLKVLRTIVDLFPLARLLAIDTLVRGEWKRAKDGLQELLKLSRTGETDLVSVLSRYNMKKTIVLTDQQGWEQISAMIVRPYLSIVVSDTQELSFRFG